MFNSMDESDCDGFGRMLQSDSISKEASWNCASLLYDIAGGPPILGAHAGMSGAENAGSNVALVEVEEERGNMLTGGREILLYVPY